VPRACVIPFAATAASSATIKAYDSRREMVGVAFRIANLTEEQLHNVFAGASGESVSALSELFRRDTDAFVALAEMLADVRWRIELARLAQKEA
jgi:hypothetical protein